MRNKILGLLICLIIVGGSLVLPLKKNINLRKPIKHFINGVECEQSGLEI